MSEIQLVDDEPEPSSIPSVIPIRKGIEVEFAHASDSTIQAIVNGVNELTPPPQPGQAEKYLYRREKSFVSEAGRLVLQQFGYFGDQRKNAVAKTVYNERNDPRVAAISAALKGKNEQTYSINYATCPINHDPSSGSMNERRYIMRKLPFWAEDAMGLTSDADYRFDEGHQVDEKTAEEILEMIQSLLPNA